MKYISLRTTCTSFPKEHAKVLRLTDVTREEAERIGEILTGTSKFYARPPGELSCIGVCALCHGPMKYELMEIDADALTEKKSGTAKPGKLPKQNARRATAAAKPGKRNP